MKVAVAEVNKRSSSSSGRLMTPGAKQWRKGKCSQAPGPKYSGKMHGKNKTRPLSRAKKACRLNFRTLAGLKPCSRVRVGAALGYLKNHEGKKCFHGCGTKLTLRDCGPSQSSELEVAGGIVDDTVPVLCRYYCKDGRKCPGGQAGISVESDGKKTGVPLGGRGRAPAGEGLLAICLACQPWAGHHPSQGDCALVQGVSASGMQLYLDEVRRMQAKLNIQEQKKIQFTKGMLIEWDECGIRAEKVKCKKPCSECKDCPGYRLKWNRWIAGVQRGNRKMMVIHQLPFRTSAAGGGGVLLSDVECDRFCKPHLGEGVICLTDGASPYEAFASGELKCSPDCVRVACIDRAKAKGKHKCMGWRPRVGRDRFKKHYNKKRISHGIVTHDKEEWCLVKQIRVFGSSGQSRLMKLKHGTQVADGMWAEVKQSYPSQVHSFDSDRLAEYVNAWAWRARRVGDDIFSTMAKGM
jgi:hypothetical protein